ncbi:tetratricopeptide repeat protein [Phocaeicola oris]|uniref:tetratricopeptide repeat protein n=1 Tax=Phocaeicola oris TaxID=2896850 RepID=UPI00234E4CE0|nr:tetratricopeptide repeat protein [Phocaeicola oris]MCE2615338.1 hypothetical protein [Phocaeicola oris]
MKQLKYIIFFLAFLFSHQLIAQSAAQAQKQFDAGEFSSALTVYRLLVKKSPSNPAYNYYYGACCYETGALEESVPYLEKSAKRKYIGAFRYLGKAYADLYRFDEAVESYERYISLLEDKKRDTAEAEKEMEALQRASIMYKSVEDVTVIDSMVVNKNDFLSLYKLSKESGTLAQEGKSIIYQTEKGDKRIISQTDDTGKSLLYTENKLINEWSSPAPITSLNELGNVNYPFLMGDGVTLYFASDEEGTLGGYDIYVTRYNTDDNDYLKPNNQGMPFNSPSNDYMLAIDELNDLGWFASDRYQPEDSVCVYIFVPNTSKKTLDYDTTNPAVLRNAATLRSIKRTWKDDDKVHEAKQRLSALLYAKEQKQQKKEDFEFIVNDNITYTSLNQFRSDEARHLYQQIIQKQKDYAILSKELTDKRQQYAEGNKQTSASILDMEKRVKQLHDEIEALTGQVRNTEIKTTVNI